MNLKSHLAAVLVLALGLAVSTAQSGKILYTNDFEKAEDGKVPDAMLVLDGSFAVRSEGGNKFLELPGAPLDTFGVIFGTTQNSGVAVSARIFGTAKGRRAPTFGVGLNGVGGYKLQMSPAKKALEIFKGDEALASVPFEWASGSWAHLKLHVIPSGAVWKIEGKAWKEGQPEPAQWQVTFEEKTKPSDGRASLWGLPYSGTPLWFDDLVLAAE